MTPMQRVLVAWNIAVNKNTCAAWHMAHMRCLDGYWCADTPEQERKFEELSKVASRTATKIYLDSVYPQKEQ